MTTLYIEPSGGMAGDMFLAALLDLGDERFTLAHLRELAQTLVPGESRLETREVRRGSLRGLLLEVTTPESKHAPHRHLADLRALLSRAPLSQAVLGRSEATLERIARAEARVHGIALEEVHFHEVGAVDTLIDVCGAAWALERLEVARVASSAPLCGEGSVDCAHGELPVPAPGTLEILRGLPLRLGGGDGERLTPTGAALLAELTDAFEPPRAFTPRAVGYGAGRRDPASGPPNLLRVQLGDEARAPSARAEVWCLEVNLDDATGEEVGFCLEELRGAGALEAWSHAVQMKKGRPGVVLSALCRGERRAALEDVVFRHTPTLGVRWRVFERTECARETLRIELDGAEVRIQVRTRPGSPERLPSDLSPEQDDLVALARSSGRSLRALELEAVQRAFEVLRSR